MTHLSLTEPQFVINCMVFQLLTPPPSLPLWSWPPPPSISIHVFIVCRFDLHITIKLWSNTQCAVHLPQYASSLLPRVCDSVDWLQNCYLLCFVHFRSTTSLDYRLWPGNVFSATGTRMFFIFAVHTVFRTQNHPRLDQDSRPTPRPRQLRILRLLTETTSLFNNRQCWYILYCM